jgi:hypothetical protein
MKRDLGEVTGTCKVCDINLWEKTDNKPAIFPCGVASCPYEKGGAKFERHEFSAMGSGLAQLIEASE